MKRHNHSQRRIFALLLSTLVISSCGPSRATISYEQEQDAAFATTSWLESRFGFVSDAETRQLVQRITARLGAAVPLTLERSEIDAEQRLRVSRIAWQTFVLDTPRVNGFSGGAGIVFITRGLISRVRTEAELAAVIAHEMAHAALGHTTKAIAVTDSENTEGAEDAPKVEITLDDEIAADGFSVRLLRDARYNPQAAVTALMELYQPDEPRGGADQPGWRQVRSTELQRAVSTWDMAFPGTNSSREFNKVRARLRATPEK